MINFYLNDLKETNNVSKSIKNTALKFNVSFNWTYKTLIKEKVLVKKEKFNTLNFKDEIINLYKKNNSIVEISKIYKCNSKIISKLLIENNILIKHASKYSKYSNKINSNYFNKIDTSNKAYLLGLLYADGNVNTKRNVISITLHEKDIELINFIKSEICEDLEIYTDKIIYKKLCIFDNTLKNDLIKLGCVPNKTHILEFPTEEQVSNKYIFDFIRGYFDGDGCVSNRVVTITGKNTFLEQIHIKLNIDKPFKCYVRFPERNNNIGSSFYTGNNIYHIYKQLYYNNSNFYLQRKYLKFKDYLIRTKKIQNE